MKVNYNLLMEQEINKFQTKKTIMLHSCCGPCSSAVIERLSDYFDITILYYNPNIEPEEEYLKRKNEQKRLIKLMNKNIKMMDISYDHDRFLKISKNLEQEKEGGARCHKCYYLRLEKTLEMAGINNFDYFGTTLTVSPYKNSDVINEIGLFLEKEYLKKHPDNPVLFLVSDFKKKNGYKRSIELSNGYNLYRQDYCGCHYARENALETKK